MKTDSSLLYRRSATNRAKPSVGNENDMDKNLDKNLNRSIDENWDLSRKDEIVTEKLEDDEHYIGVFYSTKNEKKNGATLLVMTFLTLFLFLLAGLSIKLTSGTNPTLFTAMNSLSELFSSAPSDTANESKITTQDQSSPTAAGMIKPLSEMLSSRISLISSNNPKFIVTADGTKIIPSDTIDDGLTLVDIFIDHVLVSSNGETRAIAY